ncbi:FK506 binding protein 1A, 12kDa, transcript variant X2, partial [Columba livia]
MDAESEVALGWCVGPCLAGGAVGPGPAPGGSLRGRGGCSAPASLCHLTVNLPSPPPQPRLHFWRWVYIRAPPRPENSVACIELSLAIKKNSKRRERGWWGVSSKKMPHPLPLLPERNHQSPVVPSLSRPDRSLLTPDAGHRRLPGLTTMQSFPRCCPTCPLTPPSHLVREIAAVHFLFHRIKVSSFIIAIKMLYAGFSQ